MLLFLRLWYDNITWQSKIKVKSIINGLKYVGIIYIVLCSYVSSNASRLHVFSSILRFYIFSVSLHLFAIFYVLIFFHDEKVFKILRRFETGDDAQFSKVTLLFFSSLFFTFWFERRRKFIVAIFSSLFNLFWVSI